MQTEQSGFIASTIAKLMALIPQIVQMLLTQSVNVENGKSFTMQDLLMGKYDLFSINIFKESSNDFNQKISKAVSTWYFSIRNFAIIISLLFLIYIAIRMAVSTVTSDKVKYKKMLTAWFVGFAMIFILHYLIVILINLSDQIVKILCGLAPTVTKPFEEATLESISAGKGTGWGLLLKAILFWMLVWYQFKFFFMYFKRVLSNAFLIIISPLITVTYAADKANDCKAQAFTAWMEEFISNVFMQPLHLLLMLVMLYSAGEIAATYPIIAILFMLGLSKSEKLLRSLFKLNGATVDSLDQGTTFRGLLGLKK